jgi:hypothetical protein
MAASSRVPIECDSFKRGQSKRCASKNFMSRNVEASYLSVKRARSKDIVGSNRRARYTTVRVASDRPNSG